MLPFAVPDFKCPKLYIIKTFFKFIYSTFIVISGDISLSSAMRLNRTLYIIYNVFSKTEPRDQIFPLIIAGKLHLLIY